MISQPRIIIPVIFATFLLVILPFEFVKAQSLLSMTIEEWEQGGELVEGNKDGIESETVGALGGTIPDYSSESQSGNNSEPPQPEEITREDNGGEFENGDFEKLDIIPRKPLPEVDVILEMIEQGQRKEAYPLMLQINEAEKNKPENGEKGEGEGEKSDDENEEDSGKNRKILMVLLMAGEGVAPPENQEIAAREFTDRFPDDEFFPVAFFYLSQALHLQNKPLEDSFFFDAKALKDLQAWMQTSYLKMKSESLSGKGQALAAAEILIEEMQSETSLRESLPDDVLGLVDQANDIEGLEQFFQKYSHINWLLDQRTFLRTNVLINQGEIGGALLALDKIQKEGLASTPKQIKFLHSARAEIDKRVLTVPGRIGVLLPLSSSSPTLRKLALETLDGLRMAVQFSGKNGANGRGNPLRRMEQDFLPSMERIKKIPGKGKIPFELMVRDTANNPNRAGELVEELVREENVMAIIGPIARNESTIAAARADSLGVPLISLSLTLKIPPGSRFIFRHSKSQKEEVRDLVDYAMDYKGAKRFTILFPKGGYGRVMAELFWKDVTKRGGKIVGAESYKPFRSSSTGSGEAVGFKNIFDNFTGLKRPIEDFDLELMELVGDNNPDPIVDFDAMFIPIGPGGSRDLRLIAPYPVTVNAENVLLLGSRFWNSDTVVVASENKLDGAVFIDAFDRRNRSPAMRKFRQKHLIMFGHRAGYLAPSYFTALGYDTLNIIRNLLKKRRVRSPEDLAKSLTGMEPFPGITGLTTFLESGEAVKESQFFTIKGEDIWRIIP